MLFRLANMDNRGDVTLAHTLHCAMAGAYGNISRVGSKVLGLGVSYENQSNKTICNHIFRDTAASVNNIQGDADESSRL